MFLDLLLLSGRRPRYTTDIDIVIELFPEKILKFVEKLKDVSKDIYIDEERIKEGVKGGKEFNTIDSQTGFKIDFWPLKNDFEKSKIKKGNC